MPYQIYSNMVSHVFRIAPKDQFLCRTYPFLLNDHVISNVLLKLFAHLWKIPSAFGHINSFFIVHIIIINEKMSVKESSFSGHC